MEVLIIWIQWFVGDVHSNLIQNKYSTFPQDNKILITEAFLIGIEGH